MTTATTSQASRSPLRHPVAALGLILTAGSLGGMLFALVVDLFGGIASPYAGLLLYLTLPALLVIGLISLTVGTRLARRSGREAGALVINWSSPRDRSRLWVGIAVIVAIGAVLGGVTHGSLEYMATTGFCTDVCHRPMEPQAVAHRLSAHANVACAQCHIGPGAAGFVRAKLGGVRQAAGAVAGRYSRPIPAEPPDRMLGQVVCERCHNPERDYGIRARVKTTFAADEQNTRTDMPVKLRVGSPHSGVHWHVGLDLQYLSADGGKTIQRVRVRRRDGTAGEYAVKDAAGGGEWRPLGCTGCHNRVGHDLRSFDARLDESFREGVLPASSAGLKQRALAAVGDAEAVPTRAELEERVHKLAAIGGSAAPASEALVRAYRVTYFPEMRAGPQTYPSHLGHAGCYRCHGALEPASGQTIRLPAQTDCNSCHQLP